MKKLTIFCFALMLPIVIFGQSREITGKVFDENNMPLPGANIAVTGSNNGGSTDFDGVFKFDLDDGTKEMVVSFVGYKDKAVTLTANNNYIVQLELDSATLDEVVVVGYGTQRKSDITGAVTSVEVDEQAAAQNATVDQILQGRAAGVQVNQNGTPGSGVSVRIRGSNSLRGNNEPLYVVDGVIISSAGEDAAGAGGGNDSQEAQSGLNGINPRDIKSMEVLKDASATAIYGSRGANGVVLITTKQGKKGKSSISGYLTNSISEINSRIDVLSGVEFAMYRNESGLLSGNAPTYHIDGGEVYPINVDEDGVGVIGDTPMQQVNWHDEIYKQGLSSSAGANFSGGGEKGTFYVSVGYNNQGGIVDNSKFENGSFNINLSQNLSDKFKINARLSAYYAKGEFAQDGDRAGGQRSFINNIITYSPLINTAGDDEYDIELGNSNPYSWVNDFEDVSEEKRLIGNLAMTYNFNVKGLSYKLQVGGNMRDKSRDRFYGLTTFQGKSTNGSLQMSVLNSKSYQINNLFNYSRTFNRKHRVNAVAGLIYDVRSTENTLYAVTDFSTVEFTTKQPKYGQSVSRPLEVRSSETQLLSYLGRATYTFDNKYVFTGTFRADGSSKFSEENRFSYFPSFAFAWRAINEKFLDSSNAISDLKIRTGWGKTGNQGIQPYQTLTNYDGVLYGNTNSGTSVGFAPINIGNSDLKWETTSQLNIGVDFGLFNNRLSGTVDVYKKETKDLLQLERLGPSAGFSSLLVNRGNIDNNGIELTLSGIAVEKEDFSIEVGGNIAFNRMEISKLGSPASTILIDGEYQEKSYYLGDNISSGTFFKAPANVFIEGEEIGLFYGWETNGIWQSTDTGFPAGFGPGDVHIVDQNDDGKIDGSDRTIIGNPNPDFVYGGYFDLKYKRLSFNVLMNGVSGNDIANGNMIKWGNPAGNGPNIMPHAYHNAWRPDAESNTIPRINYNKEATASSITDQIIEDGSYLRISNITLGYEIPVEKSNTFSRVNVYVSGINMVTFTKYSGYNPQVTSFMHNGNILGVDWLGMPNTRTMMLGLNLNF